MPEDAADRPAPEQRGTGRSEAVVRFWLDEEGWGVVDCADTPGGCWVHFTVIQADGYRSLIDGETVEVDWEQPGFDQDGFAFRALSVWLRPR